MILGVGKEVKVPRDEICRWVLSLYDKKEIPITDEEEELCSVAWEDKKGIVNLGRVKFSAANISSIFYRPLVETTYKDPFREEKRVNYEIDSVTGVAKIKE